MNIYNFINIMFFYSYKFYFSGFYHYELNLLKLYYFYKIKFTLLKIIIFMNSPIL